MQAELQLIVAGLFDKVEPYLDQFWLTDGEKSDVRASALLNGTQVGMGAALSTWKSHQPWQRMGHYWILC